MSNTPVSTWHKTVNHLPPVGIYVIAWYKKGRRAYIIKMLDEETNGLTFVDQEGRLYQDPDYWAGIPAVSFGMI